MKYFIITKKVSNSSITCRRHPAALIFSVLLLVGCASSQTPYAPASGVGQVGYSESQLSTDRYRVSYTGGGNSSLETVQDYALLRAAEITVAQNFSWFEIADRTTVPVVEENNAAKAEVAISTGISSQTRCGLITCNTTRTSPDFPRTMVDFPDEREYFVATMEIMMGNGEHERSANIYEAREVISSIRAEF